jgi:AraC-like DNA-binding protein/mannose-6-phosphate isomerase-like protein (cupin superfamily)
MDRQPPGAAALLRRLPDNTMRDKWSALGCAVNREAMKPFVHRWEDAIAAVDPLINSRMVLQRQFRSEFPIEVRFLKFDHKSGMRLNRHNYFEVLYLYSGEAVLEVLGRDLPMKRGDLFVMGAAQLHRVNSYGSAPVKAAILAFLPEIIRGTETGGDDIQYLVPFLAQDDSFPHVIQGETGIPAQVFDLMLRISHELPATNRCGRLSVKTYLKMILVLLLNHYAAIRGSEDVYLRQQGDIERLAPLFDLICRCYGEAIPVEDAALAVRMSKSHFMRFFRHVTGQPFVAYLNHFRVAKAEVLLTTTDKTIAEISQEVGFCDQSYFGLVFRGLLGVSPRDYKSRCEKPDLIRHTIAIGQLARRAIQ